MNVPKLRFKEFDGEWEENSLAKLATFSKGKGISKDNLSTDGKPCILYGELYTKYKEVASTIYSRTNIESSDLIKSEKLDVLIPSSGETAKDIACSTCIIQEDVLIGGDLNILRFGKEIDGRFISYQINGIKKLELSKYAQGATVVHLYSQGIKKLRLNIPTIEEQKKISELLLLLNKKIQLQQQKIDLLQEQKKGYMQKVFNETLRFYGFKSEWKEYKLENVTDVRDGTHDSPKYIQTGYPLITSKNLKKNGDLDFKNINYISEEDFNKINQRSKVDPNDILFGMIGTIGNPVKVKDSNFAIKNVALIKHNPSFSNDYLIYYLKSSKVQKQFYNENKGGTQKFIALSNIRNLIIRKPVDKYEEELIIAFFDNITHKIKIEQKKLKLLQKQKQGFMQQMFI